MNKPFNKPGPRRKATALEEAARFLFSIGFVKEPGTSEIHLQEGPGMDTRIWLGEERVRVTMTVLSALGPVSETAEADWNEAGRMKPVSLVNHLRAVARRAAFGRLREMIRK